MLKQATQATDTITAMTILMLMTVARATVTVDQTTIMDMHMDMHMISLLSHLLLLLFQMSQPHLSLVLTKEQVTLKYQITMRKMDILMAMVTAQDMTMITMKKRVITRLQLPLHHLQPIKILTLTSRYTLRHIMLYNAALNFDSIDMINSIKSMLYIKYGYQNI